MTEVPEIPDTAPTWLPDLTTVPFTAMACLDLTEARAELLARIAHPLSTVAGSEGS